MEKGNLLNKKVEILNFLMIYLYNITDPVLKVKLWDFILINFTNEEKTQKISDTQKNIDNSYQYKHHDNDITEKIFDINFFEKNKNFVNNLKNYNLPELNLNNLTSKNKNKQAKINKLKSRKSSNFLGDDETSKTSQSENSRTLANRFYKFPSNPPDSFATIEVPFNFTTNKIPDYELQNNQENSNLKGKIYYFSYKNNPRK